MKQIGDKQLISDIFHISCVLENFCKTAEQTHDVQCITAINSCLNDKIELSYKEINN